MNDVTPTYIAPISVQADVIRLLELNIELAPEVRAVSWAQDSIEFQAAEMHAFDVVLHVKECGTVLETVDGDMTAYANFAAYEHMLRGSFA